MEQDILDLATLLILLFFIARGYFSGLLQQAAGIISIVGGFWCARAFHEQAAQYLTFIDGTMWREMAGYAVIFIAFVIVVTLIANLLQRLLTMAYAAWIDRIGGAVFGLVKGVVVCSLIFLVLGKFFSSADFYQNSRVRPYMVSVIDTLRSSLPQDFVRKIGL